MSGTDVAATPLARHVRQVEDVGRYCLCSCYAMSGSHVRYCLCPCYAMSGADAAYGAAREQQRQSYSPRGIHRRPRQSPISTFPDSTPPVSCFSTAAPFDMPPLVSALAHWRFAHPIAAVYGHSRRRSSLLNGRDAAVFGGGADVFGGAVAVFDHHLQKKDVRGVDLSVCSTAPKDSAGHLPQNPLFDKIGNATMGLCKSDVVFGANVEVVAHTRIAHTRARGSGSDTCANGLDACVLMVLSHARMVLAHTRTVLTQTCECGGQAPGWTGKQNRARYTIR
eukprot:2803808-Rhodomonas_salina.3